MRTWERKGYKVVEKEFDFDLHEFSVIADNGKAIATITPGSIEDMQDIVKALDNGEDVDGWEDGMGNTIRIEEKVLQALYDEWRQAGEEASEVAQVPFTWDCGEAAARVDFSEYAGLEEEISYKDMLELEKNYTE